MIKLKYGSNVVNIPGSALEKLHSAGERELRVLIAVCARVEDDEIPSVTGLDSDDVASAVEFWRGAGVFEGEREKQKKITPADSASRVYTGDEIAQICQTDKSIDSLIVRCREILGSRVFTHAESSSVVYLRHNLALDPEYILLLCAHYSKQDKITMRFIEKKAIDLYDSNIRTVEALEKYLSEDVKKHDAEYKIRKLFGLGERALVAKEQEYIKNWVIKWQMSDELIKRAYEETVANTKTPTLAYANAILKNWHESGVSSDDDAAREKKEYKKKSGKKRAADTSFDLDEFFDLAIARGEGNAEK